MTTRIATARSTSARQAVPVLQELKSKLEGVPAQLVVVFASSPDVLEGALGAAGAAFPGVSAIGCTTAGEFTEASEGKGQFVAWAVGGDDVTVTVGLGTGLKADVEAAVEAAIVLGPDDAARPHRMAIMLLDPLSGNGEEAALLASTVLGPTVRLAGGAAGDDLQFKRTVVALGGQLASDAVVVAVIASRKPLGLGVRHGHKPLSKPLTITKAEGGTVHEIDGRPAYEVWKDEVRAAAKAEGVDVDAEAVLTQLTLEPGLVGLAAKVTKQMVRNNLAPLVPRTPAGQ